MTTKRDIERRGMTLVELLVVVVILGLLGVATLPTINSSGPKRRLREAATAVESHLNQAVSKAVGSRTGAGAWLQADDTAGTSAATILMFCSGGTEAAGTATLTLFSATSATCGVSLDPSFATLTGTTSFLQGTPPSGCLIRFPGFPFEYTFLNSGTLTLPGSATTSGMLWPASSVGTYSGSRSLPFSLSIPPGKTTGGKTVLGGNTCVDLPSSTVGVWGYSRSAPENPSNAKPLIITYDSLGRAKSAVYQKTGGSVIQQRRLDSRTPIALLVGLRDQVGATFENSPTEQNPGTNWQRSDSWWVVVDPRTSATFRVPNVPNAPNTTAAQRFIRQTLLNDNTAQ
jgi:prepilin-type N-terminal cleavage/methylation domain-containing protein